jgi:glycosyltransferase involved in cell wall biosynthesis
MGEVTFHSHLAHAGVPAALAAADLLVLPSHTAGNGDREGIPITLLEAQATGLPVLATAHGGIPEGLPAARRDGLAKEKDPTSLATEFLRLWQDRGAWPDRSVEGLAHVRAHFSRQAETAAWQACYGEVWRERGGA